MTIASLPAGMTGVDFSANFGLFGFWHNVNSFAGSRVDITTTTANTIALSAADTRNGWYVVSAAAGATAGWTLVLASTASIIGVFAPLGRLQVAAGSSVTTQTVPFTKLMAVKNLHAQTATLTAGDASTTVTGTATIAQNTTRFFLMSFPTASTILVESLGLLATV